MNSWVARIVARDCGQTAVIADNAVIADISFIAEIGSAAVCDHPGRYKFAFPITRDLPGSPARPVLARWGGHPITRSPDPH
jgi:hypothetical protein